MNEILVRAKQRAIAQQLPYEGALTPQEAYQLLQSLPNAKLVDVRTRAELELVGRVPQAVHIEWASYPGMVANANFSNELTQQVSKDTPLIFMCRTGGRSHNAAVVAESLGFIQAYNMLEGFEGEANQLKQRTLINGWRHAGLPWVN
ncbi:MAG: rhodanese-like domain-containing protein [Methylotenera sp.]|nr:rhodanese-like domain-containing protein [Methylotenera sp.]